MTDVARYSRADVATNSDPERRYVDAQDYDALLSRVTALEGFKAAVVDALVINHNLKAEHETDARLAVADLVHIECEMALDTRISERAALAQRSRPATAWVLVTPPPGWQLVPYTPTPEMVSAPFAGKVSVQSCQIQERNRQRMADNYTTMLDHAPVSTALADVYVNCGLPARRQASQMGSGQKVLSLRDEGFNEALDLVANQTELKLTETLERILNFPPFGMQVVAARMEKKGLAEFGGILDPAKVLHWMLNLYLQHGENWGTLAIYELGEGHAADLLRRHR